MLFERRWLLGFLNVVEIRYSEFLEIGDVKMIKKMLLFLTVVMVLALAAITASASEGGEKLTDAVLLQNRRPLA